MPGKSVAEKLQIKPNSAVWSSHAEHLARLEPLPAGAYHVDGLGEADVALVFVEDAASLRTILAKQKPDLAKPAAVWIVYPKANRTDVNRDTLWGILTDFDMRPNSQVAVDDVWSALRFRSLREGEPPFTGGR